MRYQTLKTVKTIRSAINLQQKLSFVTLFQRLFSLDDTIVLFPLSNVIDTDDSLKKKISTAEQNNKIIINTYIL